MKNLFLIAIACLSLVGCATSQPDAPTQYNIPNLRNVSVEKNIWRSGQPQTLESWQYLHNQRGINIDLKLNTDSEYSDDIATNASIKVVKIPITFFHQMLGPNDADIQKAIEILKNNNNILIHCSYGHDRTGLITAIYWHEIYGLPKSEARANMLELDFHRSLLGLDWYWREKVK